MLGGLLLALLAGVLVLGWVMPVFRLPRPTGVNAVGTRTVHWKDGERELVVQVWYPAAANGLPRARYVRAREVKARFRHWVMVRTNSAQDAEVLGGAHPVVVFGPMWGGRRTQDTFLAEELASYGYVVAAVDHPGNAARVEMSDGRVVRSTMAGALEDVEAAGAAGIEALWARELEVWVRDDAFVLDEIGEGGLVEGASWIWSGLERWGTRLAGRLRWRCWGRTGG